jgi:Tfp pilus assembly protein PilV
MNLKDNSIKGLTLVEVVISAGILALALSALLLLFGRTTYNAGAARGQLQALQVARTEFEKYRSRSYSNVTTYATTNMTDITEEFFIPLGGQRQCTVSKNVTNGYKEVALTISWASATGTRRISQTFYTVICNME